MQEADLRLHLAKQTKKKIAPFDILKVALPEKAARAALKKILAAKPDVVLFDALSAEQLSLIGGLTDEYASAKRPLFSVGSSGIEMALAAQFNSRSSLREEALTEKSAIGNQQSAIDLGVRIVMASRRPSRPTLPIPAPDILSILAIIAA